MRAVCREPRRCAISPSSENATQLAQSTDGPHINDVPLEAILPRLYDANVGALSVELANPRHQHEHKVFRDHPLPDGMLLLPSVIDTTVNYVEHPKVVADRICQVAEAIGASVFWYKLRTLAEGAALASERLW